ncbi:MAG: 5'/3'-nucleotidase SurE, partial [Candidatus Brocadiia bacterium]
GYSVQGSPADCVKLAIMQICKEPFELLVSGINSGANVGINVYYSGTVAAAMEGAFLKIPSVALSLCSEEYMDYAEASRLCIETLKRLMPVKPGDVININIPHLSRGRPKGVKVVSQSTGGFDEYYIPLKDQLGQTVYQLAMGPHRHEEPVTDTTSLSDGYITITALEPDMTNHLKTKELAEKFGNTSPGE